MKKEKQDKQAKSERKKQLPPTGELNSALTMAARSLKTKLSLTLLDCGLYAGQDGVILALATAGKLGPGELARQLGVKAPTMTRTITRLQAQGFVERREDEGDGRASRISLTKLGEATVDRITGCIQGSEAAAIADFNAKDSRQLVKLLRKLDENLRAEKTRLAATPRGVAGN